VDIFHTYIKGKVWTVNWPNEKNCSGFLYKAIRSHFEKGNSIVWSREKGNRKKAKESILCLYIYLSSPYTTLIIRECFPSLFCFCFTALLSSVSLWVRGEFPRDLIKIMLNYSNQLTFDRIIIKLNCQVLMQRSELTL